MSMLAEPADLQDELAPYVPTPEEIRLACLAIQATWSPDEEQRRRVFKSPAVESRTYRAEAS